MQNPRIPRGCLLAIKLEQAAGHSQATVSSVTMGVMPHLAPITQGCCKDHSVICLCIYSANTYRGNLCVPGTVVGTRI